MYLIANASRKEVAISDLGITLRASQAIDLHKIETQIPPENSKDLQRAKRHGAIKILHQEELKTVIKEKGTIIKESSFDKDGLLQDIKKLLSQEIDKKISSSQNTNNAQMTEVLAMMQKIVQNNPGSVKSTIEESSDTNIGQGQLVDIHSRSLNKMSKEVLGAKLAGKEEVKDSKLSDNVDELSKLL